MRRHNGVGWAALIVVFAGATGRIDAATMVSFQDQGTHQAPFLEGNGVTVTGSGPLTVDPNSGLNIPGGLPGFSYRDGTIDETEWVSFRFNSGAADHIRVELSGIGGAGTSLIEALDLAGASLGTRELSPVISGVDQVTSIAFDISSAFSQQPISAFRIQPKANSSSTNFLSIASLQFENVPEPTTLAAWGFATVAFGLMSASRRKWSSI